MAQKYIMWGDTNNVPFMTLKKGKFECILKSVPISKLLYNACRGDYELTLASFPKLTTISSLQGMADMFNQCDNLTSASFPKLTTISGKYGMNATFANCHNLTSVSFPELTTISGEYGMYAIFLNCSNLTSVSFPKLTTVNYPNGTFIHAGPSTLTIHLPKALSSLGITNNNSSNSSSYCSFVYDL